MRMDTRSRMGIATCTLLMALCLALSLCQSALADDDALPGAPLLGVKTTGAVDVDDARDVYSLNVKQGQVITTWLSRETSGNVGLTLYCPLYSGIPTETVADRAPRAGGYPRTLTHVARFSGRYYLSVSGEGTYTVSYELRTATPESDSGLPGWAAEPSPMWGWLDAKGDSLDVSRVYLAAGQRIDARLSSGAGLDCDMELYGPGTTRLTGTKPLRSSSHYGSGAESFGYVASRSGWYYIACRAESGSGFYSLSWIRRDTSRIVMLSTRSCAPGAKPTIAGRLLNRRTGRAIADQPVAIYVTNDRVSDERFVAATDARGLFRFTDSSFDRGPGTYRIRFETPPPQLAGSATSWSVKSRISLSTSAAGATRLGVRGSFYRIGVSWRMTPSCGVSNQVTVLLDRYSSGRWQHKVSAISVGRPDVWLPYWDYAWATYMGGFDMERGTYRTRIYHSCSVHAPSYSAARNFRVTD